GRSETLRDDCRRVVGDPAQAALLPAGHEPAHLLVVGDRRSSLREAETPSRAFAAALDGPRRRRAAALAQRRLEPREAVAAAVAQCAAGSAADETAPRQQQVQQAYGSWLLARVSDASSTSFGHEATPQCVTSIERVRVARRQPVPLAHAVVRRKELLRI